MSLKKLRDWLVEGKIYFTRTYTYLNIFNFLMIVLVFLNTTLWEYDFFQQVFPNRKLFLLAGVLFVIIITIIIGYVDTHFKFWRTENERNLTPDRNPLLLPLTFQCAKMINDLKQQGKDTKDIEASLNEIFERCQISKEFEFFKKNIDKNK